MKKIGRALLVSVFAESFNAATVTSDPNKPYE